MQAMIASAALQRRMAKIFPAAASIILMLMVALVLLNVSSRYLFNAPLANTHEVVSYWLMPAVVLSGFVLAKTANEHIDAPLLFHRLGSRSQQQLGVLNAGVSVLICAAFGYFTFIEALNGMSVRSTGGTSGLPIWPVLFLPPITFGILLVFYARDGIRAMINDDDDVSPTAKST